MTGRKRDALIGHILVVDDKELNRDLLSRRLQRLGHTVTVAAGGQAALDLVDNTSFDLIVLDIMMPDIDGIDVLQKVRQTYSPHQLPIIMATGKTESKDMIDALQQGANDYITKPLDFPVVQARIQTQLQLKRLSDELLQTNAKMKRSLDIAAGVQRAGLPDRNLQFPGFRFAWRFFPCDELAGDGLLLLPMDAQQAAIGLWDVSGHGVPAALLSVSISHVLRLHDPGTASKADSELIVSPAAIADHLNANFPMSLSDALYFTMCFGTLNNQTGRFRYVSAGHENPIRVSATGTVTRHRSAGLPMGLVDEGSPEDDPHDEFEIPLDVGDRLYIFSDGLTEEMNGQDEQFGSHQLPTALSSLHTDPIEDALDRLIERLREWIGSGDFKDDLTVLVIERVDEAHG